MLMSSILSWDLSSLKISSNPQWALSEQSTAHLRIFIITTFFFCTDWQWFGHEVVSNICYTLKKEINIHPVPIHEFFEAKFLLHKAQMIRSSLNSVDLHFSSIVQLLLLLLVWTEKSMFHFHDKQRSKEKIQIYLIYDCYYAAPGTRTPFVLLENWNVCYWRRMYNNMLYIRVNINRKQEENEI